MTGCLELVREFDVTFYKRKTDTQIAASADKRKKGWYKTIGHAFENENGRIDVLLDSQPFDWDGRLVLFPKAKAEEAG